MISLTTTEDLTRFFDWYDGIDYRFTYEETELPATRVLSVVYGNSQEATEQAAVAPWLRDDAMRMIRKRQ